MNSINMLVRFNDNIGKPVKSSTPHVYNHSEYEIVDFASHLPSMNRRKSPGKDARDAVTDSNNNYNYNYNNNDNNDSYSVPPLAPSSTSLVK